jgi:hypothetical protein
MLLGLERRGGGGGGGIREEQRWEERHPLTEVLGASSARARQVGSIAFSYAVPGDIDIDTPSKPRCANSTRAANFRVCALSYKPSFASRLPSVALLWPLILRGSYALCI